MSRGFLVGLVWGLVVCTAGLAVLSLVAPKVQLAVPAQPSAAAPAAGAGDAAPEAEVGNTGVGTVDLSVPKADAAADADVAAVAPAEQDPMAVTEPAPTDTAAAEPAPAEATAAPLQAPQVETSEARELAMAQEDRQIAAAPGAEAAPPLSPTEPASPQPPGADAAPVPDAGTMPAPKQDKLLEPPANPPVQGGDGAPEVPAAETGAGRALPQVPQSPQVPQAPEASAEPEAEAAPLPEPEPEPTDVVPEGRITMEGGLDKVVPGVTVNRLPSIGGDQGQVDAAMGAQTAEALLLDPQDSAPIKAFARDFLPEAGVPRFAVLLQDIGAAGMARDDLARLPFAVTFVIDPASPDAAEAARAYRAAGQEVMMLIGTLPEGATPADLEQSFQAMALQLPETVAVLDLAAGGLQENRVLATQAIPILKAQGRGIVTYDRGLGAADQVAQREGLAHASIFRALDAEGETIPVIRRYLDRAAFKAAQEGQVVVIGQTRPDTVAALLEWMVEGRGATVQMAPITAMMQAE